MNALSPACRQSVHKCIIHDRLGFIKMNPSLTPITEILYRDSACKRRKKAMARLAVKIVHPPVSLQNQHFHSLSFKVLYLPTADTQELGTVEAKSNTESRMYSLVNTTEKKKCDGNWGGSNWLSEKTRHARTYSGWLVTVWKYFQSWASGFRGNEWPFRLRQKLFLKACLSISNLSFLENDYDTRSCNEVWNV